MQQFCTVREAAQRGPSECGFAEGASWQLGREGPRGGSQRLS